MAVCRITNPGTVVFGKPVMGGLSDPALGTSDNRGTCATCKNTYGGGRSHDCPGHFGYLQVWANGNESSVYSFLTNISIAAGESCFSHWVLGYHLQARSMRLH